MKICNINDYTYNNKHVFIFLFFRSKNQIIHDRTIAALDKDARYLPGEILTLTWPS